MPSWQTSAHADFSGGENRADNPRVLPPNQAVLLENALITGRGQIERRKGMTLFPNAGSFPARIDVLARYRKRSGQKLVMVVSGGGLYLADATPTLLKGGLSSGPYGWALFADKFLLVDGQNFYESDGTPAGTKAVPLPPDPGATLAEIRRCTALLSHFGRLYGTGDPQLPHAVYYSQTDRYDYFKSQDMMFVVSADDAEPIQVFDELFGGIVVGKRSGWWLVKGDPGTGLNVSRLITGSGPVARAYAITGSQLFYVAEDGIRVLLEPESGTFTTLLVSREHQPLLSQGDMTSAVMAYHDNRVLLFYRSSPQAADNDRASVLDLRFRDALGGRFGAWTSLTGWPVTALLPYEGGTLLAGTQSGRVVRLFDGDTDLGAPIVMRVWTPEYPLTEGATLKLFDGVDLNVVHLGTGAAMVVHETVIDGSRVTNTLPVVGFDGSVQQYLRLLPRVKGTFIQHRIQNASPAAVAILSVGERWRALRPTRSHEVSSTGS